MPFYIIFFSLFCIILEFQIPFFSQYYFNISFNVVNQTQSSFLFLSLTYLFFVIFPIFFIIFFFKKKLSRFGVRWPNRSIKTKKIFFMGLPIALFCLYGLSQQDAFQKYYASLKYLSFFKIFFFQTVLSIIYYIAEEFFFRGFLFLSLWEKIDWHSIWITEIIFAAAHFSKPTSEILFSIPVGIILNILTLWSRSILPAIIFHSSLGIFLLFVI